VPYDHRFAEFNESTYAQVATAEVTDWLVQEQDLMAVPITPHQTEEADLGYDLGVSARWGMVYLQFKVSEYMRGGNAAEYWYWNQHYFRFKVKTDMTTNGRVQHNTLCDLESREASRGGLVLYMAPLFLTQDELFLHLLGRTAVDQSVFASPLQLGLVAPGDVHRYTYTSHRDVVPFSEPGPERPGGFDLVTSGLRQVLSAKDPQPLSTYLAGAAEVLGAVGGLSTDADLTPAQRIAQFSYALSLQPWLVRYDPEPQDSAPEESDSE